MTAATQTSRTIEVFRPGTFTPMGGVPITFSAADLRAVAAAYDAEGAPTPAVIGHPTVDAPAYGWAKSFSFDEPSQRLLAEVDDLDPSFAALVAEKKYRKVSLSFIRPADPENPKPGTWYPRHIGFLGATPPAVSGLKPVSFSGEADPSATFEFAAEGWIARLLRRLRDRMIEKDGVQVADEVLPDWELRALDEMALRSEAQASVQSIPAFASPQKDPQMTTAQLPADFAAREAALSTREAELAARERQTRHAGNVSFAAELEAGGRILPVHKDRLVGVLDAIGNGDTSVSFAGTAHAPAEALREILRELPQVVPYGRLDISGGPQAGSADFAAPDGAAVDEDRLKLHNRALAYQAAHAGTAYLDAVRAAQALR